MKQLRNWVVYDLETGGLKHTESPIVEIFMVMVDCETLELRDTFHTFVLPYANLVIKPDALIANGIALDTIMNCNVTSKDAVDGMIKFFKKCNSKSKKPILVGHNIKKFDNKFLEFIFEHNKKDLYDCVETHCEDTIWFSRIRDGHNDVDGHSLGAVCQRMNVELINAHRAESDTRATAALWVNYVKLLRSQGSSNEVAEAIKSRVKFRF